MSLKSKTFEAYSLEDLSKNNNAILNYLYNFNKHIPSSKSQTWEDLYKYSAYYFDNPTQKQRNLAFKKIRTDFDGLLRLTNNPQELPRVNNRNQLLSWVCRKHKEDLNKREVNTDNMNCNANFLKSTYGPDSKYIEDLFESKFKLDF